MGVLSFNGTSDKLKWTTLASALANVSDGAWTYAALFKRSGTGTFDALGYLLSGSGAGTAKAGMTITNVDVLNIDIVGGASTSTTFTNTSSPYLFVLSKGSGAATPRLAWKLGSGGSWTHENLSSAVNDQIAATMLEIGAWQGGDFFAGWIGVIAWWEGAMSDANKEALDDNWRTSDVWNSAHGNPQFLAECNVAGASVVDLAGNASVLTATGTTLDSGETLDNWNFNGVGFLPQAILY